MSRVRTAATMSIGQLADRVGASPSAIRYWERSGLLDEVPREGGCRRYPPGAVDRIGMIRLCQDAGFGISEIRELLTTDPTGTDTWKNMAETKLTEIQGRIARLRDAAQLLHHSLACPAPSLSDCPRFTACVRWRADGGDPSALADRDEPDGDPAEQQRT